MRISDWSSDVCSSDLSAHPACGGIVDIELTLERGSLTVITGPVGAGKSTVLRCLLGLAPVDEGAIEWNGRVIDDPSQVLVPPRVAYLPQVPRLFSEPLPDATLLGVATARLEAPVPLACPPAPGAW